MNRQQRRYMKRKIKGGNFVDLGDEKVDHSKAQYCWLHKLNLDNIDRPTERDKKIIESVRLKPFKSTEKNGVTKLGRMCQRCGNVLWAKSSLEIGKESSILETEDKNENANIYLPNMPH